MHFTPIPMSMVSGPAADPAPPPWQVPWVWEGYLAGGALTLLTSMWKTGKTTLLSVLLARRRDGGAFAGRALAPGRSLVVSEESPNLWRERGRRLPLGDQVALICRPFRGLPTLEDWRRLVDTIVLRCADESIDLVVIDPLALMVPAAAEQATQSMHEALLPLRQLTDAGVAVLLMHHPRRAKSRLGQAARGTGALQGFADILIEMHALRHASRDDRRRRLLAHSRYPDTPRDLVIALNPDGTDYTAAADLAVHSDSGVWPTLRLVLAQAGQPLTRRDILDRWVTPDKPDDTWLWRCLERAIKQGLVAKDEQVRRGIPIHYRLI